jgi:hypothetical protein
MPNEKLTLAQTNIDNLLANLRGEVGEVITGWLLMRHFIIAAQRLRSDDPQKEFTDKNLQFTNLMADKLSDELVGRLSELAERKIGRLTFYFAARKLGVLADEASDFEKFIIKTKIRDKRNRDISHKALPSGKSPQKYLHVLYRTFLRAVGLSLRLMKKLDRRVLGPSAPFLWREARKRRYDFLSPPHAAYMLVPYLNLSPDDRIRIVLMEQAEGKQVWSEITTLVDGQPAAVLACKQWAVIVLGGRLLGLDRYPLVTLSSLSTGGAAPDAGLVQEGRQNDGGSSAVDNRH